MISSAHILNDRGADSQNEGLSAPKYLMTCRQEPRMLNVEKDRWHSLVCLESGSVLYESKDGPCHPLEEDEIMVK